MLERNPALRAVNPQDTRTAPELERADRPSELALARKDEKGCAERVHVCFTSVRKRLLDPDNVVCKWTLDALRFSGVLRGDEPDKITLEIKQRKAEKGEEEHTLIELFTHQPINQPDPTK